MQKNIIIICGATASGKSKLALELHNYFSKMVIINADALQIYRDIPILTAQPSKAEQAQIPHQLYGFLGADCRYSVADWLGRVEIAINDALSNNVTPILVGGTGMYLGALLNGIREIADIPSEVILHTEETINQSGVEPLYHQLLAIDKNAADYFSINDKFRIMRAYNIYKAFAITPSEYRKLPNKKLYDDDLIKTFCLLPEREILYRNCENRFEHMIDQGVLTEIEQVFHKKYDSTYPIAKAIGYKELYQYMAGDITLQIAKDKVKQATRNYIKRQTTWFNHQLNNNSCFKTNNAVNLMQNIQNLI